MDPFTLVKIRMTRTCLENAQKARTFPTTERNSMKDKEKKKPLSQKKNGEDLSINERQSGSS